MGIAADEKRRMTYTELGIIYRSAPAWKRKKVAEELKAIGFPYTTFRSYLIGTPAYHIAADAKAIIINNFPESIQLFERPVKNL